ncbi:MAG: stage II sporulation protein M, partial [Bacilli bacterium]|nr:stage II sporulation protein M [Bacilli bacterium]
FSIGIMINIYGYIGILIGIFSIFPHQIINIIIYLFLSFYGIKLSLHLISFLFLKKQFNFGVFMKKYLKVILASSIILIVSSLYETFLSDYVIKIFTFLLK